MRFLAKAKNGRSQEVAAMKARRINSAKARTRDEGEQ